jgi:hypothetical protein
MTRVGDKTPFPEFSREPLCHIFIDKNTFFGLILAKGAVMSARKRKDIRK